MRNIALLFFSAANIFAVTGQSDESQECTRTTFKCLPHECIFDSFVCDGHQDCSNNKDELSCGRHCQIHHFGCSNGTCIRNELVCDGHPDCNDGEEEKSCGTKCFSVEYTCTDGQCVMGHNLRCNGNKDCNDGSDEMGCGRPRTCLDEEFTCRNGSCIKKSWVCDSVNDCSDGGDEKDCPMTPTCSSLETTCPDGRCVSSFVKCIWISSMNSTKKDETQQCLLGQGCLVKVLGLVFGLLSLLTVVLVGSLYWRYRQRVFHLPTVRAGDSQYLPLGRHQGPSSSNEAITMDNVT